MSKSSESKKRDFQEYLDDSIEILEKVVTKLKHGGKQLEKARACCMAEIMQLEEEIKWMEDKLSRKESGEDFLIQDEIDEHIVFCLQKYQNQNYNEESG
mmetsp:Transcript_28219/g.39394  ORF Transcript_28219/g.39394 Transcript_28219/m.39394 type:complete len:99 (+) Transcript_28219:125-421(+)